MCYQRKAYCSLKITIYEFYYFEAVEGKRTVPQVLRISVGQPLRLRTAGMDC